MVAALIQFTQGFSEPAGEAFLGTTGSLVTASNADNTGVTGWSWKLLDVPQGVNSDEDSALTPGVVLSTSSTLTFTPDANGPYRVELTVTDGVSSVVTVNTFIVPDEFGVIRPAYLNTTPELILQSALSLTRNRGWTQLREYNDSMIRRIGFGSGRRDLYDGVNASMEVSSVTSTGIGCILFDPSLLPAPPAGLTDVVRRVKFETVICATAGMTAEIRLWNSTDGIVVPNTTMVSASTSPDIKKSVVLGIPADLPNAEKVYEVQLRISVGVPTPLSRAICKLARLAVSWGP